MFSMARVLCGCALFVCVLFIIIFLLHVFLYKPYQVAKRPYQIKTYILLKFSGFSFPEQLLMKTSKTLLSFMQNMPNAV